jgi:NTE family protein
MFSTVFDVFRLRQYFNVVTRLRELSEGVREDAGLLDDARRALVSLPFDRVTPGDAQTFPPARTLRLPALEGKRLAVVATGGSGALASVVGVARALEEAGVRPSVISLCSGSALFGFPIAAGVPAQEVAAFVLGLRPQEVVDVDWRLLASIVPRAARGFAGVMKGDRIEEAYRRLLGDIRLGDMPVPAYAPVWNIEDNRLEYVGPSTHPDMPVARAIHMAIALPLFVEPVELEGGYWCDGGIVDIFPVRPVLDFEHPCDVALAVNGFYPPRFAGEDATGWRDRRASILYVASQVRTCQQVELARTNLARLERRTQLVMIEPVPYEKVRGVGFYRQFLNNEEWGAFMQAGRRDARRVLEVAFGRRAGAAARPGTPSRTLVS